MIENQLMENSKEKSNYTSLKELKDYITVNEIPFKLTIEGSDIIAYDGVENKEITRTYYEKDYKDKNSTLECMYPPEVIQEMERKRRETSNDILAQMDLDGKWEKRRELILANFKSDEEKMLFLKGEKIASLVQDTDRRRILQERKDDIADYLIEHKEDVIHMNLKELAEATYTSTATISRFCKKLGEKNFNDFRVHFAEITQSQTFSTINFNKPFLQDSSKNEICHNVGEIYKQTIEGTNQVLDMNELEKAVDYIDKANIIDLFAVGDSFLSALMFEHKMTYVNKLVNLKIIPTEQTQQALYTTKNSVALIISYSGQTNEIKPIVERIKINGGTIIAITSLNDSYLRIKADICLTMCSKENIINKIGTFSSKISSDYIIDLIYSLLFKKNYQELLIKKVSMNLDWDERRNESTHEKGKGE